MNKIRVMFVVVALMFSFWGFLQSVVISHPIPSPSAAVLGITNPVVPDFSSVMARVVKVVDGDTIKVEVVGNIHIVRYIGIDAPESVDPRMGMQCFGREAAEKNRELTENATVALEKDISETDRYGRWLRYVYKDGVLINQVLVAEGYAVAATYPPDVKYQSLLAQAQREAQALGRGLWLACPL